VKPLIHNGEFISVQAKYKGIKIIFRDSYKHLPVALDKLTINFGVENKTIFPYFLNDLDYNSSFPDYKYFDAEKVSLEKYNKALEEFGNKAWNFEKESIKYCEQDCRSLHQVISKYNELFFNNFGFNIHKYPTLPSLAFANYRTNFMKDENIASIRGKVSKEIRISYTPLPPYLKVGGGGALDMFIPKPLKDIKIHAYDINSLYPFVMLTNEYPVGNPTYFSGNIFLSKDNPFGFFYCKINAPDSLKHPILQLHHKTEDGIRTVAPIGNFEGMFFSEELYNAQKFGYKFEVLWGYIFKSDFIFKEYVETMYNLRLQYPKSDPMNTICKLLLNSLYGRFGMNDNLGDIAVIDKDKEDYLFDNTNIKDIIDIESHVIMRNIKESYELETETSHSNINIAVASAVTAYARIYMSQFKNNPNLPNLYYTDTDSTYFDGPLPDYLVSQTELGKMKLEGIFDKAIFLAPKVYALENKNESIIKIKGLTKDAIKNNHITLDGLELLIDRDYKLTFNQKKWFRSLPGANINILDQIYTLQATISKRELVFNENNKLIGTKPFAF